MDQMREKHRIEVAMFRYRVIAPLPDLAGTARMAGTRRLAGKPWVIPGTSRTRIAEGTILHWLRNWRRGGLDALKPGRRRDRGRSRRLGVGAAELLIAIRREHPGLSVRDVIARAGKQDEAPGPIPLSSTCRLFHAEGLMDPVQAPQDLRRLAHLHAGDLWQSDVMHGPKCGDGRRRRKTCMIVIIDDATRIVPWSAFAFPEGVAEFLPVFRQALLRRAIPKKPYTDNGSACRSRRLELVCARLGVALIHARPCRPRGKGKCERHIRTVRQRFLPGLEPADTASLDVLDRRLAAWVEGEYHHRPHRGLEGMTPADAWAARARDVRLVDGSIDPDDLFLEEAVRKVGKDRVVSLRNRLYEVGAGLVGQKVTLRFDPAAPPGRPIIVVTDDGDAGQAWPLDPGTNARVKRGHAISFSSIGNDGGEEG